MAHSKHGARRAGRKRLVLAAGAGVGVAALITTAAFTDFANLNLGADGVGASQYNIQVIATDPTTGAQIPGSWQEADSLAGVPVAITGADALFPGGDPVSVSVPVRNASADLDSTLELGLAQLPDAPPKVTSADYLASLRFDVAQAATALDASPVNLTGLTFAEVSALDLNDLEPLEESAVTLTITLLDQATSGAAYTDNSLNGKKAYLQAAFTGSSVS